MTHKKKIIFIHGANASNLSFNYMKERFPKHDSIALKYSTDDSLDIIVKKVFNQLVEHEDKLASHSIDIISHSLGGIVALNVIHLLDKNKINIKINKIVSISSPYGGSKTADVLKMFYPTVAFFNDISTTSAFLFETRRIIKKGLIKKLIEDGCFLPIVTNIGLSEPLMEASDTVVTVQSQTALDDVNYIEYPYTHFEVLMAPDVADNIVNFLWDKYCALKFG